MGLVVKDLDGNPVGNLKHPDDAGKVGTPLEKVATTVFSLLGIPHHCGIRSKKVSPGNHWHSPTYKCRRCGSEFWVWIELGP